MKGKKRGIGLRFAVNGLIEIIKNERNFRIHLYAAILVIIAGIVFTLNRSEWLVLILTIHIVLITELMNSVIERIIDYFKPELHPKAKVIKDIGAAIVLVASIMAIIIGLIIFLPKLNLL